MKNNKLVIKNCLFSIVLTFIVMTLVLIFQRMTPFGTNSYATRDAEIQYLDFYGYLQNIINGDDSFIYTYNSTLGGTGIGLFSYYLSSPINILICLFSKESYLLFFNIAFILKLAFCACTFSFYLQKRFNQRIKGIFVILLSVSYALMQYNIWQASNIMWLDGVYLLPLILLGIYKCIHEKKIGMLSVSVGLSIIFNWYSGGINCVFAIFWFLVEEVLLLIDNKNERKISRVFKDLVRYSASMIIGLMISAVIFIPSILALRSGVGSGFDWESLKNEFNGNALDSILTYFVGTESDDIRISIFCGTIPLIGVIGYFIRKGNNKKKLVLFTVFIFSLLFLYYKPFVLAFSLLKNVYSFWCRYSYVVIFTLIFIASHFFLDFDEIKNKRLVTYVCIAFSALLVISNYILNIYEMKYVYITAIVLVANSILINKISFIEEKNITTIFLSLVVVISCTELLLNTNIISSKKIMKNGSEYEKYVKEQDNQIKKIKSMDDSVYRISQTKTRNFDSESNLTANYNESLSYNYMTNTGYTSCPDNTALEILNKLGYKTEGYRITVTNTSIIGSDSLLGVKYILSPYDIQGLKKMDSVEKENDKYVYSNPYTIPIAFKFSDNFEEIEYKNNPFIYQNDIYSKLLGRRIEIYKKAEFKTIEKTDNNVVYEIINQNNNNPLYGNLPWKEPTEEVISINSLVKMNYACWLSPSVFYIPQKDSDTSSIITVTSKVENSIMEEQFYYLDLDLLELATKEIKDKKIENISLRKNGNIYAKTASGNEQEKLIITIPYSSGFKIYRNGELIEAEKFEDCFFMIPLLSGENEIRIEYKMPGLSVGMVLSFIAISYLIAQYFFKKNKIKLFNKSKTINK